MRVGTVICFIFVLLFFFLTIGKKPGGILDNLRWLIVVSFFSFCRNSIENNRNIIFFLIFLFKHILGNLCIRVFVWFYSGKIGFYRPAMLERYTRANMIGVVYFF